MRSNFYEKAQDLVLATIGSLLLIIIMRILGKDMALCFTPNVLQGTIQRVTNLVIPIILQDVSCR